MTETTWLHKAQYEMQPACMRRVTDMTVDDLRLRWEAQEKRLAEVDPENQAAVLRETALKEFWWAVQNLYADHLDPNRIWQAADSLEIILQNEVPWAMQEPLVRMALRHADLDS